MGVAQSSDECEAVYRLRYQTIIDEGWAKPEDLPDGLERESYDDHAIQLVAWDGEKLAGTGRVVLPAAGQLLPTEAAFELEIEPRGQVADVGRAIVGPAYLAIKEQIFLGLLGQGWIAARTHKFSNLCSAMVPAMRRRYRLIGMHWTALGPPRLYWSMERSPYLLDLVRSAKTLRTKFELGGKPGDGDVAD